MHVHSMCCDARTACSARHHSASCRVHALALPAFVMQVPDTWYIRHLQHCSLHGSIRFRTLASAWRCIG
eukprot:365884-Chlamydomonas_euryale.AAC.9